MTRIIKLLLVAVSILTHTTVFAQSVRFDMNPDLQAAINDQKAELDQLKSIICDKVDAFTQDVTKDASGALVYPNWVRFEQIARKIEELNTTWNSAYGDALDLLITKAINSGATDVVPGDELGEGFLADIIEEQHLIYPADMASICFEEKFNFESLRKCLEDQEDAWLDEQGLQFEPGDAPTIQELIDDEEYWTLMTCDKRFVITDTNVTPAMLSGLSAAEQTNIIQSIADIVEIIGSVVAIAEQLHTLLADCGGTTTASDKNIRDGFPTASGDRWIGYVMVQKGKTFDFANKTQTKIKGKAKIWKLKANGKRKKDRNTRVGINFCAKEQNECAGGEWPSDPSFYQSPTLERRKKVKIKHFEPKALSIQLSTHFLQFKYFKAGGFEKALNLLGSTGCQ